MSASRTSGAEMSAPRTSSSSPSYHTVDESPFSKLCDCGLNPKLATSFTVKNPYRRFLRCPKFQPHQCGFFRWVDAWRPPQVEDVSTLNGEAERAKVNMWIQMYSDVLKDLDNRREVMKQLGVQIEALQKENKKLKKELFMVRVIIASIVLLVVAIILA